MTRKEQLEFCKRCANKGNDFNKGIICKLTNDVATFENECPDYIYSAIEEEKSFKTTHIEDDLNAGLQILSFCIPLAGAIIYFVKMNDQPKQAKKACNLAIAGFVFGLIIRVLSALAN